MKRITILLAVLAVFLWVGSAAAYLVDGDVSDWGIIDLSAAVNGSTTQAIYPNTSFTHDGYLDTNLPSSLTANYITEDNADKKSPVNTFVGPGYTHTGNTYDAEALYFDNDGTYGYIAIITGVGPAPNDQRYGAGDIAIALGSGYGYGIDVFNGGLFAVKDWQNAIYFNEADPWAISGGDKIGNADVFYSSTPIEGHYVIEASFLLSDLLLDPGDMFDIHWTMECGNDVLNLRADVNPVPEPATMLLLGVGLCGLAFVGRKKLIKQG